MRIKHRPEELYHSYYFNKWFASNILYWKDSFTLQVQEYKALCFKPNEQGNLVWENHHQNYGLISSQMRTKFKIIPSGFCVEQGIFSKLREFFK